jgi:hypothetical protein
MNIKLVLTENEWAEIVVRLRELGNDKVAKGNRLALPSIVEVGNGLLALSEKIRMGKTLEPEKSPEVVMVVPATPSVNSGLNLLPGDIAESAKIQSNE